MKKQMKKLLSVLMISAVVPVTLWGCSPGGKTQEMQGVKESSQAAAKAGDTGGTAGTTGTAEPTEAAKDTAKPSENQDYPARDIQWIIPYPAGSATDLPARVYQPYFEEALGGKMIVTNMPGSAGTVAAAELMNTKADGYTISSFLPSLLIPYILGSVDFYYDDFDVICQYGVINHGLVVRADSPYQTLEELLDAARENPGTLNLGGSFNHVQQIALLELKNLSGADYNIVEIGGTAIKAPELLSGRVDAYIDAFSACASYINSGEFRCLAVFADERDPFFPDVPTAKECGYDVSYDFSFGLMAPKGTPQEILDKLEAAAKEACENPEYEKGLSQLFTEASFMGHDEYRAYLDDMKGRLEKSLNSLVE